MKNKYVFILTITVICSLLLSLVSEVLEERQDKNVAIDRKKNILSAVGVDISKFSILDMGTGAGIPGLILAMHNYSNISIVDSNSKKN